MVEGELERAILDALVLAGKNLDQLTLDDVAPIDHFHSGGKAATLALASAVAPSRGARVLDIGGGLGGAARVLADAYGCQVTVLDPNRGYLQAGAALSNRMSPAWRIDFVEGEAPQLGFPDAAFDLVFMQHSTMNVRDRGALVREVHRILRPSGRVGLQEVVAGDVAPVLYPTPWAPDASESTVLHQEALRGSWEAGSFQIESWVDATADVRTALAGAPANVDAPLSALGLHLLTGENAFREWSATWRRNVLEERVRVVRVVMSKK